MSDFVLDTSVTTRWLMASTKNVDQAYAMDVLWSLEETRAVVPSLWFLEVISSAMAIRKRDEVTDTEVNTYIAVLEDLPLSVDDQTSERAFGSIMRLAQRYNLTSYDATYLELAIRENLPLATLDKALKKAAIRAGVELYLQH